MTDDRRRYGLLALLALLWGPSFYVIKVGLRGIPPISLAAGRVAIAGVLLYGFVRLRGGRMPSDPIFWRKFAVMGILANVIPFSLLMIGETLATSALAAIFNGFVPIVTAVTAHLVIPDEKMNLRSSIALLTGFGGILLIFLPTLSEGLSGNDTLLGMLAFTGMSIGYGVSVVYSRTQLRGYPAYVGPTAQLLSASLFLIPIALAFEFDALVMPDLESTVALVWLAVVATALAYVVYYRLVDIAGATFVSLVTFLLPPLGVLFGVLLLDEAVGLGSIIGCALILVGVGLVRKKPQTESSVRRATDNA